MTKTFNPPGIPILMLYLSRVQNLTSCPSTFRTLTLTTKELTETEVCLGSSLIPKKTTDG